MKLVVERFDELNGVDRDGILHDYGAQGLDVTIGSVELHFVDERHAVEVAKAILKRMGWTLYVKTHAAFDSHK